jgi:hypothetical protein
MKPPQYELIAVLRSAIEEEDGLCLDNEHERDHLALALFDALLENFELTIRPTGSRS